METEPKTKVIFRKRKNGSIIAIFPEELGTRDYTTCSSYEHIGQHGACTPDMVILSTKLAKSNEYDDLIKELESIGYNLEIIKRNRYDFQCMRKLELRKF